MIYLCDYNIDTDGKLPPSAILYNKLVRNVMTGHVFRLPMLEDEFFTTKDHIVYKIKGMSEVNIRGRYHRIVDLFILDKAGELLYG